MNAAEWPRIIGLVADDLTGAGDSAVAFAEHGWRVLLHLNHDHLPTSDDVSGAVPTVMAVSTGARALTDAEADTVTADLITALRAAGADRIYLKIDSTVRGSVAGQVSGALRAWGSSTGTRQAVICPAFPEHHRTVVQGHVFVAGVPLHQTPAATDPVTPRTTSDLTALLPGATWGDPGRIGGIEQLILDAASDEDLDHIAAALSASGSETLMVGAGGLAAALARCWSHRGPGRVPIATMGAQKVLIAASSLHPVTAAQLKQLPFCSAAGQVDVLTTTTLRTTPEGAAGDLANRVAAAVVDHTYGALIAVGGDGAAAILDRLSADHLVVDGAVCGGCPTGIIIGGTADGLRLVTKSGGFGDPETLGTLVSRLHLGVDGDTRSAPDPAPARLTQEDDS